MSQILIVFLSITFGFYALIKILYSQWISSITHIPQSDWLLVLGAGIENNNQPSPILEDRLISTVKYAKSFNPKYIILSGTKKERDYNEPIAMLDFLLSEGIGRDSLILDESGFSTYHSCMNIKKICGHGNLVIISQRFHLYRSLMISRLIGLQSFGLVADNYTFSNTIKIFWYLRESLAIPYNLIRMLIIHIFRK